MIIKDEEIQEIVNIITSEIVKAVNVVQNALVEVDKKIKEEQKNKIDGSITRTNLVDD